MIFVEQNTNQVIVKTLLQFLFKCQYEECKELIKMDNYYHHLESCQYSPYVCLGCNYKNIKKNVEFHCFNQCESLTKQCYFCKGNIIVANFASHTEICENAITACKYCKGNVQKKDCNDHLNVCDFLRIECPECKFVFNRKDLPTHLMKNECLSNIEFKKQEQINLKTLKELQNKNQLDLNLDKILKMHETERQYFNAQIETLNNNNISVLKTEISGLKNEIQETNNIASKFFCCQNCIECCKKDDKIGSHNTFNWKIFFIFVTVSILVK